MKNFIIATIFLFATSAAYACSCMPEPPPLNENMQTEEREFYTNQWKRKLSETPNIFSAVIVKIDSMATPTYSARQSVNLSQVEVITGNSPGDSKVFNAYTSCLASLKVGEKYIFFTGMDMQVSQCSVQPYSDSAVKNIDRAISLVRGGHAVQ